MGAWKALKNLILISARVKGILPTLNRALFGQFPDPKRHNYDWSTRRFVQLQLNVKVRFTVRKIVTPMGHKSSRIFKTKEDFTRLFKGPHKDR